MTRRGSAWMAVFSLARFAAVHFSLLSYRGNKKRLAALNARHMLHNTVGVSSNTCGSTVSSNSSTTILATSDVDVEPFCGLEHNLIIIFHNIDTQALCLGSSNEIMTASGVHQHFTRLLMHVDIANTFFGRPCCFFQSMTASLISSSFRSYSNTMVFSLVTGKQCFL